VSQIEPNGPADRAGIEPGDIIVEFDGTTLEDRRHLSRVVGDTSVGSVVDVTLIREGRRKTVHPKLGELDEHHLASRALARPHRGLPGPRSTDPEEAPDD
jgi:serine protease Do